MLHIRQAREVGKPAVEMMYGGRARYNDAHGTHQWNPDEVSQEALSEPYSITDCYVRAVNEKMTCGLFIVDKDALYWPGIEKGTSLYLHKICVDPAYSGSGYTDAMIQYFTKKGRKGDYSDVHLDVCEHKDRLRRMYERNEFQLYKTGRLYPGFTTALYIYPFEKAVQLSTPVSQQLV